MSIRKLLVENFKAFDNAVIDFQTLTVLAGANSVGKSTTIQALLLVRGIVEILKSRNLLGEPSNVTVPLNGLYLLNLGSARDAIRWESGKSFSLSVSDGNESLLFDFRASNLDEDNFFMDVTCPVLSKSKLNIVNNNFYYLAAERLGPRISHRLNDNPDFTNCGYQGEFTIDVLARRGNQEEVIRNGKYLFKRSVAGRQSLSRHAQQWLNFIVPGTEFSDARIFGHIQSAGIRFNSFYSPTNVGFGISYVLPIVVTGLIAEPGALLLVENPEAHLHPKGQSNIGYFLARMAIDGVQVIVETHSEHVINGMRIAFIEEEPRDKPEIDINYFKKSADGVVVSKIGLNRNGDLSDFPKDFLDQSQKDLLKIFNFSRKHG